MIIDEKELRTRLRSSRPRGIYVLFGNEDYLKQHYAEQIVKNIAGERKTGFNYIYFDDESFSSDALADAAELLPFGVDTKCVEVNDMPLPDMSLQEYSKLLELLRDPPETAVIVFRFTRIDPEKAAKGINVQSRFKEFSEIVSEHGTVAKLDRREADDLKSMLMASAQKRGSRMSSFTAAYMTEVCGCDLQNLQNEVEKLSAYCAGREITKEDIDKVCCRTLESDTFAMVRAIEKRDADHAFAVLSDLFSQKIAPVMILGALSSSYVNMYRAKCASESEGGIAEFCKTTGLRPTSLSYALKNAGRSDISQLRECIKILFEADMAVKNISSDDKSRTVLEETLIKLLSARSVR